MTDPMHENLANWSRGPIKVYFNRADRRLFVPKFVPAMGWTVNLAHPSAGAMFLGLLAIVPVLTFVAKALHG